MRSNESDDQARKRIFSGLVEEFEYYAYSFSDRQCLSRSQEDGLRQVANRLCAFGKLGYEYYKEAQKILQQNQYNLA